MSAPGGEQEDQGVSGDLSIDVHLRKHDATLVASPSTGSISGTFKSGIKCLRAVVGYDILWAEVADGDVVVSYLDRSVKGKSKLVDFKAKVGAESEGAQRWCDTVMSIAYKDVTPKRNLRVLVNPKGGPGKASEIFSSVVQPIFQAAKCTLDVTYTERSKHAQDIAKSFPLDTYDAIVILSGDGLIHEVFSGFAEHAESVKAFSTPICPVPTGSGNGTSLNLLGLKEGFDVGVAALNAIKGRPMKHDICTVKLGERRILSFMTVALGLMADLDLGTEHLRWMGDTRFIYGFLRGMIKLKPCPVTLSVKVAESDKEKMAKNAQEFNANIQSSREDYRPTNSSPESAEESVQSTDEWLTFDKPILYLFTGKSPYVARDLMQFPVARASDGFIDVVAQEVSTRAELLSSIDGGPKGAAYWKDFQHYYKARAYRIVPTTTELEKQNLAIDGERYPFGPFEVELHQGLASFLSPYGAFVDEFNVPMPAREKTQHGADRDVKTAKGSGLKKLACLESS